MGHYEKQSSMWSNNKAYVVTCNSNSTPKGAAKSTTRVGYFLDSVSSSTRTPHGGCIVCAGMSERNRVDYHSPIAALLLLPYCTALGTVLHCSCYRIALLLVPCCTALGRCLTTVQGNVIFNGPRAGINFNDGFGGGTNVSDNLIYNQCRESGDHGKKS